MQFEKLLWGTYGLNGDQKLQWKPLPSLETDHLINILITESFHISDHYIQAITEILRQRRVKVIGKEVTTQRGM